MPVQQQMALDSLNYIGNNYRFGAVVGENTKDATDCSGLIYGILRKKGINVSRSSADQYNECDIIHDPRNKIDDVSAGEMGDLIFTRHGRRSRVNHVRIILKNMGEGKYLVVHAPQTGEKVKPAIMDLNNEKDYVIGRLQDLPTITKSNNLQNSKNLES